MFIPMTSMENDNTAHYDIGLIRTEKGCRLVKRIVLGEVDYCPESYDIAGDCVKITAGLENTLYHFKAEADGKVYDLGFNQTRFLSTEVACGFTGVLIGLYAQGDGKDACLPAEFTNFSLTYEK